MAFPPFPWPLTSSPPEGFTYELKEQDLQEDDTDFDTAVEERDVFRGRNVCIVCGDPDVEHAHIITPDQEDTWEVFRQWHYFPESAKSVLYEPRNGMLLCPTHHAAYDSFEFYIRWVQECHKFVFINWSRKPEYARHHGRAVFLKYQDRYSPFPAIFLAQEALVRAHRPLNRDLPVEFPIPWQDWLLQYVDDDGNVLARTENDLAHAELL